MKRLSLVIQIAYDNLLTNVILTFIALACSLLIVNVFYAVDARMSIFHFYKQSKLDEAVLISAGTGQTGDELKEELSECEMVKSVESIEMVSLIDSKNDVYLDTTLFDKSFNRDVQLELEEGRMPKDDNEIAIAAYEIIMIKGVGIARGEDGKVLKERRDIYRVGDVIEVKYDERHEPLQLTVVGILAREHHEMKTLNSFPNSSVDSVWDWDDNGIIVLSGGATKYSLKAVSSTLVDKNGKKAPIITSNNDGDSRFLVRPVEGVSANELRDYFRNNHFAFADLALSGEDSYKNYCRNLYGELRLISARFVLVAVLLLLCLYSFLYLRIKRCSLELACYYINGMTWNRANMVFLCAFLPGIVIGSVFGVVMFPKYAAIYQGVSYKPNYGFGVLTVFLVLIFVVVSILPMYFDSRRRLVADIIKQE
ncbi:MAG: hypothetical protein IKX68_01765 [Clostridiales bacterium]|nr:hypothetical protein [Clostridiales bacterium]